jgi:hypothetical protein
MLLHPARWHEAEGEWTWLPPDSHVPLYYHTGKEIRFRVHSVRFNPEPTLASQQAQRERGEEAEGTEARPHVPMAVAGRADLDGLGMALWDWGGE